MEENITDEQKAIMQAKLNEMKLKRAGKIPHDAKVAGAPPPNPMANRPDANKIGEVTKKAIETLKEAGVFPDQMFHVGAELQLFAINDMILNGLTNFGGEVEKYVKTEIGKVSKNEVTNITNENNNTTTETVGQ